MPDPKLWNQVNNKLGPNYKLRMVVILKFLNIPSAVDGYFGETKVKENS